MHKKPILFTIVPLILIGICFSFYFQTAFVLNTSLANYNLILKKITNYNWFTMFFSIATGVLILRSSRWAIFAIPACILVVLWNNFLVAKYTRNFSNFQIFGAVVLFALILTPLLSKRFRTVLADRKMQWWRTAFRKKHQVPVALVTETTTFQTHSHDISETGLFLDFQTEEWEALPKNGDEVQLNIFLSGSELVKCKAKIVRLVEAKGIYPRGMGLQFVHFNGKDKKRLDQFLGKKNIAA